MTNSTDVCVVLEFGVMILGAAVAIIASSFTRNCAIRMLRNLHRIIGGSHGI